MIKAYIDFARFYILHKVKASSFTRVKDDVQPSLIRTLLRVMAIGLVSDHCVRLAL